MNVTRYHELTVVRKCSNSLTGLSCIIAKEGNAKVYGISHVSNLRYIDTI